MKGKVGLCTLSPWRRGGGWRFWLTWLSLVCEVTMCRWFKSSKILHNTSMARLLLYVLGDLKRFWCGGWMYVLCTAWCSEIGSLTLLDASQVICIQWCQRTIFTAPGCTCRCMFVGTYNYVMGVSLTIAHFAWNCSGKNLLGVWSVECPLESFFRVEHYFLDDRYETNM